MDQRFVENIFVLSIKKYEDFSIISALSKKFGKAKFLVHESLLKSNEKFDSGFLIRAQFKTQNNFFKIYDYRSFFSLDEKNIEYQRLFAIQSIASLIEKFIINIDDINIIIQYIPKILSIFFKENWLNLYIQIEFKILSLSFNLNKSNRDDIKNIMKSETKYQFQKTIHSNVNNKVEIFNFCLQKLEDIWYNFDNTIILPKERTIFKKILINFLVK